MADPNLRRVELAFLGFNMTEFATWIAILVYAYDRGGAAAMGAVSVILLVPSAFVAPFAAYAGDRFRRDRVLALDYLVQGIAMAVTAATLYLDAPVAGLHDGNDRLHQHHVHPPRAEFAPARAHGNARRPHRRERGLGVVEGTGKMLGPIIAGILLASSGPWAVFATFAVVTLLGALLVSGLRVDVSTVTPDARIEAGDVWRETLRGFRTLRSARGPRLIVLLMSSGVIVVGALDVLFVATAIEPSTSAQVGPRS